MRRRRRAVIDDPELKEIARDFFAWINNEALTRLFLTEVITTNSFTEKVQVLTEYLAGYFEDVTAEEGDRFFEATGHLNQLGEDLLHTIDSPVQFGYSAMVDFISDY